MGEERNKKGAANVKSHMGYMNFPPKFETDFAVAEGDETLLFYSISLGKNWLRKLSHLSGPVARAAFALMHLIKR